jgi:hypothetical protein
MTYLIPTVTPADLKNYPKAVLTELKKVQKAELPFKIYSYTKDLIEKGEFRLKAGFTPFPPVGNTMEYKVENTTYRGKSPKDAYAEWHKDYSHEKGHYPFTLLQYLRFIQQYPEFLKKNLYLDFCADELRYGVRFSDCPVVYRYDGGAWLDSRWASNASGDYGSFVFAWESAGDSTLGNSTISDNLAFDSEITLNGKVYILKENVNQSSELVAIRKELMSLANKVSGALRRKS